MLLFIIQIATFICMRKKKIDMLHFTQNIIRWHNYCLYLDAVITSVIIKVKTFIDLPISGC